MDTWMKRRGLALAAAGMVLPACTLILNFGYSYSVPHAAKIVVVGLGGIASGWVVAHSFAGGVKGFFIALGWTLLVSVLSFAAYAAFDQHETHAMAPLMILPLAGLGIIVGTLTGRRDRPPKG